VTPKELSVKKFDSSISVWGLAAARLDFKMIWIEGRALVNVKLRRYTNTVLSGLR